MEKISSIIPWVQISLSILLIIFILIQQSDAGLGSTFGGGDTENVRHTRRGFEKFAFFASIIISILFVLLNIAAIIFQ